MSFYFIIIIILEYFILLFQNQTCNQQVTVQSQQDNKEIQIKIKQIPSTMTAK